MPDDAFSRMCGFVPKERPPWFAVKLPEVQSTIECFVSNPRVCPECGRAWKLAGKHDQSTECEICREALDNED